MITDPDDGEDGFTIVGDDRAKLIQEAYTHMFDSREAIDTPRG
jgi:hypothetical protein